MFFQDVYLFTKRLTVSKPYADTESKVYKYVSQYHKDLKNVIEYTLIRGSASQSLAFFDEKIKFHFSKTTCKNQMEIQYRCYFNVCPRVGESRILFHRVLRFATLSTDKSESARFVIVQIAQCHSIQSIQPGIQPKLLVIVNDPDSIPGLVGNFFLCWPYPF